MYQLIRFNKMNDQDFQQLLHGDLMENVRRGSERKTPWFSIGFILGSKLRQVLRTMNASEMEAYISHLRNASAPREYDGGSLVEPIARLCELYARKELKAARRRLAETC